MKTLPFGRGAVACLAFGSIIAAAAPFAAPTTNDAANAARLGLTALTAAWNRSDLEGALEGYCRSPDITWVNAAGVTHGYDNFAQSMRTEFGPGSDQLGVLTNDVIDIRGVGDNASLVVLRWSIVRDGKFLMGGVSTQLWAECQGRMRIVFEHAS